MTDLRDVPFEDYAPTELLPCGLCGEKLGEEPRGEFFNHDVQRVVLAHAECGVVRGLEPA